MIPAGEPSGEYRLAGVTVPDPLQALECPTSETLEWLTAKSRATDEFVRRGGLYGRVRERLASLADLSSQVHSVGARGLRVHFEARRADDPKRLLVSRGGERRDVLYDPESNRDDRGRPRLVSWMAASPDGATVAIGVCADGSEVADVLLLDLESRTVLARGPTAPVHSASPPPRWLPDSSGLLYVGLDGDRSAFDHQVFSYERLSGETRREQVPWIAAGEVRAVDIAPGGVVAIATEGFAASRPVAIGLRTSGRWCWRPFVTAVEDAMFGCVGDDRYVAVTFADCDRGRVVEIGYDRDPNDRSRWRSLVPEADGVMVGLAWVRDDIYVHELIDLRSRIRVFDLEGTERGDVRLPFDGSASLGGILSVLSTGARMTTGQLQFSMSRLSRPPVHLRAAGAGHPEGVRSSGIPRRLPALRDWVEPVPVRDGEAVLIDRLARSDLDVSRPHPILVMAYGGFNVFNRDEFSEAAALFAASGGEVISAHVRGNGERGKEWWRAGRRAAKQASYDDLYAVAGHLIDEGSTEPGLIALTGLSNGGLLAAVAAIQRPELWGAVVSRVGWLDPLGGVRDAAGRLWFDIDLGDVDRAADVRRVLRMSPFHNVIDGVRYPPMYLDAAHNDSRVPFWMSAKLAARMWAADPESRTLLRIWSDAGHGAYDHPRTTLDRTATALSFVMHHLGMTVD